MAKVHYKYHLLLDYASFCYSTFHVLYAKCTAETNLGQFLLLNILMVQIEQSVKLHCRGGAYVAAGPNYHSLCYYVKSLVCP